MLEREVHLRDYLSVIRKHDFIIIVSFLLIFGAALTVSLYMPRMYEATAIIEVQSSSKSTGLSSLMQGLMSGGADQASMETICRRFASRPILAETIRNLKRAEPEMARSLIPAEALASRVRTGIVPDTRMIEITVSMRRNEGGSERAVRIANELISVMQTHRSAKSDAKIERRQNFINDKMEDAESQIDSLDQDVKRFLKNDGGPLVWEARSKHIMTRLENSMKLRDDSKMLMAAEQKRLNELEAKLAEEPEWVENSRTFKRDVLWDIYRVELVNLEKKLVALTDAGEENPEVKSLKAQIRNNREETKKVALEATSPSGKTESRNLTYQALLNQRIESELSLIANRVELKFAEGMLVDLENEIDEMFSKIPEKQFQLDKMNREARYKVGIYKALLDKKIEVEIWADENSGASLSGMKGGIEFVDTAQPGSRPVSPRTKFIGAMAGLVGLIVGLAMAFLAEYFENTYQSPDEAQEALDIPVLGIIPSMKERQADGVTLPVLESPASAEAESFSTLVTNIEFSSPETPYKALLITSGSAGEGKSFVVANLAVAMAQARTGLGTSAAGQVILIDCDMRKPIQHKIFGVENQIGLSNLLVGNAELRSVIQDTGVPNLKLITCGPTPPNPVELLKSQRMSEILDELRDTYGMLLCDSPPVLPVADSLVLASKLDGVLLLADLGHTPREAISQAKEQISKLDVPLLGLICNKVGTAKYSSYYYHKSAVGEPLA